MELSRLLDIFKELGLHSTDPTMNVNRQGAEHLLSRIYTSLGPTNEPGAHLIIAQANEILLGWLTYILDPTNCGRLSVNGLKVALSTLVRGKPIDKFTCALENWYRKF